MIIEICKAEDLSKMGVRCDTCTQYMILIDKEHKKFYCPTCDETYYSDKVPFKIWILNK
jgi:predicted RNA-binding Zn-ribbon protein involved in translation (DUF1610 family)